MAKDSIPYSKSGNEASVVGSNNNNNNNKNHRSNSDLDKKNSFPNRVNNKYKSISISIVNYLLIN